MFIYAFGLKCKKVFSLENNEYKVGDPPCRPPPCAEADHQFCTIIVWSQARDPRDPGGIMRETKRSR